MREAFKAVKEFHDKHDFMVNGDLFNSQMDSVLRGSLNLIADMLLQTAKNIETLAILGRDHGDERLYRTFLQLEEEGEMIRGFANRDLEAVADGIGDTLYVKIGTAVAYGINAQAVFDEVHASNMTKPQRIAGDPRMRRKVGGYRSPRIMQMLERSQICFVCEVPSLGCTQVSDEENEEETLGYVCPTCNELMDKLDDVERIDEDV